MNLPDTVFLRFMQQQNDRYDQDMRDTANVISQQSAGIRADRQREEDMLRARGDALQSREWSQADMERKMAADAAAAQAERAHDWAKHEGNLGAKYYDTNADIGIAEMSEGGRNTRHGMDHGLRERTQGHREKIDWSRFGEDRRQFDARLGLDQDKLGWEREKFPKEEAGKDRRSKDTAQTMLLGLYGRALQGQATRPNFMDMKAQGQALEKLSSLAVLEQMGVPKEQIAKAISGDEELMRLVSELQGAQQGGQPQPAAPGGFSGPPGVLDP